MGGFHVTTADATLFVTAIGAMAGAITILWKHQNETFSKIEKQLTDQSTRCKEENEMLRKEILSLLENLASVKEELGFLKGFIKTIPKNKELANLANHNSSARHK